MIIILRIFLVIYFLFHKTFFYHPLANNSIKNFNLLFIMWFLFSAAICDGITIHNFGSIPNLSIIIFNLFHTCYLLITVNDNSVKDKCRKIKVIIYISNIFCNFKPWWKCYSKPFHQSLATG